MIEKVGIELEVIGKDAYINALKEAQRYTKSLDGKKLRIDLGANSQVLKRQLKEALTQLGQYKAEIKSLQSLKAMKFEIQIQNKEEIAEVREELRELQQERRKLELMPASEEKSGMIKSLKQDTIDAHERLNALLAEKNRIQQELDDIDIRIKDVDINRKELEAAKEEINNLLRIEPAINYKAVFKAGKSIQGAIGTSLETIGNGLTSISHNVITETITGIFRQLGYGLTNLATEGLSGSIKRYDILKTYPQTMEAIGFTSEDAQESIDKLNQSVLGLPTSLSDIVDVAKRYTTALGDINKGTDLAIAANNAFLASSAEDSQKYQGMLQIADLVAGKKLNAREWNSLNASMSTAMRYVGQQLGFTSHKAFLQALTQNEITNEEFLDALIKTGTTGKVAELTNITKSKLGSAIENIKNAFARGGANVLKGLDEALLDATGKDIVENVAEISKGIDNASANLIKWMKENPQIIKEWIDRIKSLDIVGFVKGTAEGFRDSFSLITSLLKFLPGDTAGIGKFLALTGTYGRLITLIGQFVKGFSPVGGVINVFAKWARSGQPVFEGMGKFFGSAKRVAKAEGVADAGNTASTLQKASKSSFSMVGALKNVAAAMGILVTVGGGLAAVSGEILLMVKAIKAIGEESKGINWKEALTVMGSIGAVIGALGAVAVAVANPATLTTTAAVLGSAEALVALVGLIATTIAGFMALDTGLIRQTADNIRITILEFGDIGTALSRVKWKKEYVNILSEMFRGLSRIADSVPLIDSIDDRLSSGNIAKMTENIKKTIVSLTEVVEAMNKMGRPPRSVENSINVVFDIMESLFERFDNSKILSMGGLDWGSTSKVEAGNVAGIVSNFVSVVTSLGDAVTAIKAIKSIPEGKQDAINSIFDVIESVFKRFSDSNMFDIGFGDVTGNLGSSESGNISTITANFLATIQSIEGIANQFIEMKKSLTKLTKETDGSQSILEKVESKINRVLTSLANIYSEFYKFFVNPAGYSEGGTYHQASTIDAGAMSETIQGISDSIENVKKISSMFKNMSKSLDWLGEGGGDIDKRTNLERIKQKIIGMTRALGEMTDAIEENIGGKNVSDISSNLEQLNTAIGSLKGAAKALMSVGKSLDKLGVGADGSFPIADKIKNLINHLATALGTISGGEGEVGLSASVVQFAFAVNGMMNAIDRLVGTDTSGLTSIEAELANIGKALDDLDDQLDDFLRNQSENFRSAGSEWRRSLLDGFDKNTVVSEITAALDAAFAERSYTTQGYNTGLSYGSGVYSGLQAYMSSIRASVAEMNSYSSRPFVGGLRNFVRNLSTGGEVLYRADGGSIFKPRGTDTVPAMLTKGEWVMRRHAVDTLGKGFMNRINNLDIPGAMASLYSRAGAKLSSISPKIINNTTNNTNNARVTQNIFSSNPDYPYRRASRFVKAL